MDKILAFMDILCWIFGIWFSIITVGRILAYLTYDEVDKMKDMARGYTRTYPIGVPLTIVIICFTWLAI